MGDSKALEYQKSFEIWEYNWSDGEHKQRNVAFKLVVKRVILLYFSSLNFNMFTHIILSCVQQLQQAEFSGTSFSREIGSKPENKAKNRYKNILPCEYD